MSSKERAEIMVDKIVIELYEEGDQYEYKRAKEIALISVDEKFDGIVNVIGQLKTFGHLEGDIFLKVVEQMNKERELTKTEIEKL